jgi:hypothetical protein
VGSWWSRGGVIVRVVLAHGGWRVVVDRGSLVWAVWVYHPGVTVEVGIGIQRNKGNILMLESTCVCCMCV